MIELVKIIESSYEILDTSNMSHFDIIEQAARTCYQSWDYVQEGSAEKLTKHLLKRNHWAMIEHATIIIKTQKSAYNGLFDALSQFNQMTRSLKRPTYLKFTDKFNYLISGNLRAFHEFIEDNMHNSWVWHLHNLLADKIPIIFDNVNNPMRGKYNDDLLLEIVDGSTLTHAERYFHDTCSVRFIANRGLTHELVRHRPCSFGQESTRFVDYGKIKYGGEITIIKPPNCPVPISEFDKIRESNGITNGVWKEKDMNYINLHYGNEWIIWYESMVKSQNTYFDLRNHKIPPEIARSVLPIGIKSEIICTATLDEWRHIFELRTSKYAHPLIRNIMRDLHKDMKKKFDLFKDLDYEIEEKELQMIEAETRNYEESGVEPNFDNLLGDGGKLKPFTFKKIKEDE